MIFVEDDNGIAKINRQSRDTTVQRSGRATNDGACTGDRLRQWCNDEGCGNNIDGDDDGRFDSCSVGCKMTSL